MPLTKRLTTAARAFKASRLHNLGAVAECVRESRAVRGRVSSSIDPLREALGWLERAQDATPDRGVSRAYAVGWVLTFDGKGWQPSYPETTGYIIPTFFDCAEALGREDLRRRAIEMADWEIEVHMPSGAVMGGTVDETPTPAVFNTGQVMLGWIRAYQETGQEKYKKALFEAAAFLIDNQDDDGAWRRANSQYVELPSSTTYNARVGWALMLTGKLLGHEPSLEAGMRNMARTMSQQTDNGWFADNCLTDSSAPLTHTICYVMEGLLGAYAVVGEQAYLRSTLLAADHLAECVDARGMLPGRFDASWRSTVDWSCLTGSCQFAGVLLRLHRITANQRYLEIARRVLSFVARTQNCVTSQPGLRGGIKGSFPFNGGYGRYEVLSWATKFFVDALLLDRPGLQINAPAHGLTAAGRSSP